jgi:AcrR family transcriptional regulator
MTHSIPLSANIGEDKRCERRDAAANRARIEQVAEALFVRDGVAAVTMADIAKAAGVGKGTLYRRFANKADLCLALMDSQMKAFQDTMLARMRQMMVEEVAYVEQLKHFLTALVHFTDTHAPLLAVVQREQLSADDTLERPHFWQFMTVNALLRSAAAAGELRPDLDLTYLSEALLAPLNTSLFLFQRSVRGFSLDRIAEGLNQLVDGLHATA